MEKNSEMQGKPEALPRELDESMRLDLVELLGESGVAKMLARLSVQLSELFADDRFDASDRMRLARDAHAMVSAAGLLGFSRFSALCAKLEDACRDGRPLDGILADLKSARQRVASEIAASQAA